MTPDMTPESALITFLSARLDEDEAMARKATRIAGPGWTWETGVSHGEASDYIIASPPRAILADMLGSTDGDMAAHIARHDPARVLREVAAKRRILVFVGALSLPEVSEPVLSWLAEPYSDHPDYRPSGGSAT